MEAKLTRLLATLARAAVLEDAATETLRALLAASAEVLAASPFGARGRILRGMVHLRPSDGYRRLVVVEHDPGAAPRGLELLPSATAWRWVSQRRAAVAIDVERGTVEVGDLGGSPAEIAQQGLPGRFDSHESLARLLDRSATHVLVLPLTAPGGHIAGMISIEADCPAASGQPFVWPAARAAVQPMMDAAAPYLATLPPRPVEGARTDELLPVVGATMAGLVEMLRVFARQEETILLSGPTGAGKSRLASWCHKQSRRRAGPFETLDLATVPEELQMAELFGWKKGAFTGALKDTPGCIARALAGTLFVDEVDKLSLKAQAGLLRVLEERLYRPLGEAAGDRPADVRFVVGTNADLHAAVRAGSFREDLYYRINVLPVRVPPLAERADEIPAWAAHMLERRHRASGAEGSARLSAGAERALCAYDWPGNLRQLDNIVRRAYALALMDGAAADLVLDAPHVQRALAYESGVAARPLLEVLQVAAAAFVLEAERQRARGVVLDLEHVDAFGAFVLAAAVEKLGSREEAFRLFGKDGIVANRNTQKVMRRELEKVDALCKAIGHAGRPPLGGADGEDR